MRFECDKCQSHYFYGSHIQGGDNLDLSLWGMIHCLRCDKKYLFHPEEGFKAFDPEIVK